MKKTIVNMGLSRTSRGKILLTLEDGHSGIVS